MTTPQKRRQLARSIAAQLENDSFLKDDLHAELAARKMEPLTCPTITEDLDDSDSDIVKEYLEAVEKIPMEQAAYDRVNGMMEELADEDYDIGLSIWAKIEEIKEKQWEEDKDQDFSYMDITISRDQHKEIVADMKSKLQKLQKLIDALAE